MYENEYIGHWLVKKDLGMIFHNDIIDLKIVYVVSVIKNFINMLYKNHKMMI